MPILVEHMMPSTIRVAIVGDLTIYTAPDLRVPLIAAVSANENIEIDLGAVKAIDSAGLQLLVLAERECRQAGKLFKLSRVNDEIRDILTLYDVLRPLHAA